MIYTIGSQSIQIDNSETKQDKGTPNQVVPWRDVAITCRNLYAVTKTIPLKNPKIVDGIARSGFWGAVFRDIWPKCNLHLNDYDIGCKSVLSRNFPNEKITHKSVYDWFPPKNDIVMLDFDNFTLKKIKKYEKVFKNWSKTTSYMLIADSACFGFKFGNMVHYGINHEEDYYYLLSKHLQNLIGMRVTKVSKFTNAGIVLIENCKNDKIEFIKPEKNLHLAKGNQVFKDSNEKNNHPSFF